MGEAITDWVNAVGEKWLTAGGFFIGMLFGGIILLITVKSIGRRGLEDPFAEWEDEEDMPDDIDNTIDIEDTNKERD